MKDAVHATYLDGVLCICGSVRRDRHGMGHSNGIAENHSTFSAHAHLNLLGWVSCSLMGAFYALAQERAPAKLVWVILWLSAFGPVVMIPSLAAKPSGFDAVWVQPGISVGSLSAFLGMATFVARVIAVALRAMRPAVRA